MNNKALLSIKDLYRSFKSGDSTIQVLQGIDMEINHGEILAITGSSGVGKSTLLNIIGMLDHASSGSITFDVDGQSHEVSTLAEKQKSKIRNEFLGFVFQFYHLLPDLNVIENVMLPAMVNRSRFAFRRDKKKIQGNAEELLMRVGLKDRMKSNPAVLSGGERQRVAIARALINKPVLLLCDEPTGNLDTDTSEKIHGLFQELNQGLDTAFLLVTHDNDLANRADRSLKMDKGQFIYPDAPATSSALSSSLE